MAVGRSPVAAEGGDGVEAGVLAHELRIFDAKGRERELGSMLDELAKRDVVLLGETHLDDATHRFEHAVLDGLAKRRDGKVVLSMEMFERDVQGVLDRYLAGELEEAAFLEQARPWGNYRPDYRPLVETAKARKLPVVAANTPRPVLRTAAQGAEQYAATRKEHPEWLPEEVFPASDAYWARVDRAIRGHGPGGGDRLYSVQNLWDNTMADSIVGARKAHPAHAVLHVVGAFHVEQHDGTVAQLRRRAPKVDLATITVVPTSDLARVKPAPERADFVVYAQGYASGPSGDELEVVMPAMLKYRLHVPEGPAPAEGWPLLVWLVDDEQRASDAVLRWRLALGGEAAVIVVEPPHRSLARAGWEVERWGWPASLSEDLSAASVGVQRIVEYVRRGMPVRSAPVLVAGEGAGATLALWSAQYGEGLEGVQVLAIAPDLPRALRSASIPDERSTVAGVEVLGTLDEGTIAGLRGAGVEPKIAEAPASGLPRDAAVRAALGLAPASAAAKDVPRPDPAAPMAEAGQPIDVRVKEPSALSEGWAALYTSLLRARGHDARLVLGAAPGTPGARALAFDAGATAEQTALLLGVLGEGKGLPRPPDMFGGAVVVLVPRAAGKPALARWSEALAKQEAAQGFMKSPYRAVREGDDAALRAALDELRSKGRTEVLVVPAELCATAERMLGYVDAVEPRAEGLSLHWLPGLGYHVVRALAPEG